MFLRKKNLYSQTEKSRILVSFPYWLLAIILIGLFLLWKISKNESYTVIFLATSKGILTTVRVTVIAFTGATIFGLLLGLLRTSQLRFAKEIATFYIEIIRGIPMLVILYYIAFVGAPALVTVLNWLLTPLIHWNIVEPVHVRQLDFVFRAILALMIGYSAFIAEIFRAGIESVDKGQSEAAFALGMSNLSTMIKVILPQAVRNVLPSLANEFVAMIKDSALVSALGVQDITQLGKVYSASTFKFFETYNIVAYLYLIMTITLSLCIKTFENYLKKSK